MRSNIDHETIFATRSAEIIAARTLLWLMACSTEIARLVATRLDRANLPSDDWRRLIDLAVMADGTFARLLGPLQSWGWGYAEYALAAMLPWEVTDLDVQEVEELVDSINAGQIATASPQPNDATPSRGHRKKRSRSLTPRLKYAFAAAEVKEPIR